MTEPIAQRPRMAAYGVPDDPHGLLDWSWALERLSTNRNFWLTHVDPKGRPHSMPLWGVWDGTENVFWFSTAAESFRVANLATNPAVVVATDDTVEVVSVEGVATKVEATDPAVEPMAIAWGTKYGVADDEASVQELISFFAQGAVYRIDPLKAFGLIERPDEFGPAATRWVWPTNSK